LDRVRPPSPVVLTGDIHSAWAANLFAGETSDVLAIELVCSSITSTFLTLNSKPTHVIVAAGLPDNPHIRYFNGMFRGYCLCDVDRNEWRTQYRAVGSPTDAVTASATDPNDSTFLPMEGDPLFTDATAVITRGFNRRGEPQPLAMENVITGAA
jgi:alkaline phosphatase D